MRLFIGILILFSLLFLFGGLLAVGLVDNGSSYKSAVNMPAYYKQPSFEKYSMKQIDSLTSKSNYVFTSSNASGSTDLP